MSTYSKEYLAGIDAYYAGNTQNPYTTQHEASDWSEGYNDAMMDNMGD